MNTNLISSFYSPSGNNSNEHFASKCSNVPVHQGRGLGVHRSAPNRLPWLAGRGGNCPVPSAIGDKALTCRSLTTVVQQENENKGFATSASGIPLANEWQQLDAPQRSRLALCLLDRLASVDFAKTCKVLNFLLEEYH
ncbi:hypothetical protein, partial [Endozoicomonas sp. ONNA2]|uniref:hypothetical protein n=1 Tax=Endozoicomonas sp. ONNA2 TaxID=2828741 RepID=UPI00214729B9